MDVIAAFRFVTVMRFRSRYERNPHHAYQDAYLNDHRPDASHFFTPQVDFHFANSRAACALVSGVSARDGLTGSTIWQ